MSVEVSGWVWKHSKTGGGSRLLLLAIADNAGDDGDNAWPSVATLARKTKTSDRTVQRGIERLEKDGCIQVVRGAGRGGTHRYKVLMTKAAAEGCTCTEHQANTSDAAGEPVDNAPEGEAEAGAGGVNLSPVNVSGEVTQLRHRGGDTWVSPERPVRPRTPPNPPARRGARCSHGRTSCRPCGTSPRAGRQREDEAAADLARRRAAVPWCAGYRCDRTSRRLFDGDTGRPTEKCPECHPDVVVGPATPTPALAAAR